MSTKKELRNLFKEKRSQLSFETIHRYNDLILINFQSIPIVNIEYTHTFMSSQSHREVDTEPIMRYLDFRFPGLTIAVPKVIEGGRMSHICIDENTDFKMNALGIEEPVSGEIISPDQLDLVLVPLIAFDLQGNRVGYGKGFYDHFLNECRPDCLKIGLSFFEPVEEISDIQSHDISLDYCVTPSHVYSFERD